LAESYQAIDARLFLAVNHLPHTPLTNWLMYFVTTIMNGGFGWMLGLLLAALIDRKRGRQALLQIVPPLWLATMTVEYPIKYYFRRRRPFVDVVQAIAVGKKSVEWFRKQDLKPRAEYQQLPTEIPFSQIKAMSKQLVDWFTSGEVDEVWFLAMPYSGFFESTMAGKGAYSCNSDPVPDVAAFQIGKSNLLLPM
jgi:hypothetical protein